MRRVHVNALFYYQGLTTKKKQEVEIFFAAMDADRSGSISIAEFMTFLTFAGLQSENLGWLFEELDKDNNGTLDFEEVLTFFYILSREEYREILNCRASTDAPRGQPKPGGRNLVKTLDQFNKVLEVFKAVGDVVQLGASLGCTIV
ncbi:hypothetical protein EUGRSUZ_H02911 [Eucalyptus grandis]|uniref:Uncharacterized protein n=3 Tax=Eucalyptus grandis TaxID=71139 RepID=A0ACC3JU72_EUCGR|nr:hypothetical protein EUGRSUZ_H02911 [Eucalyptus grandis]